MRYAILIGIDASGRFPCVVHDDESLPGGDSVRRRFVAQTDDHAEAIRVAELEQRRCEAGEPDGSKWRGDLTRGESRPA